MGSIFRQLVAAGLLDADMQAYAACALLPPRGRY